MSLASKIFWNTLLVLAIVLGLTGWWSVWNEREALEDVITKHGRAMAQSLAAFSVEALVAQDYPSLDKALHTIGRSADNILYLQITRGEHQVATYGRADAGQEFTAPVVLDEEGLSKRQIGEVRAILSTRDGETLLAVRIRDLLLNSLILFIVLALALHILIHRLVLRRLALLTKATDGVIAEHICEPARAIPVRKGDELDLLQTRYARLLQGLQVREQERTAAMHSLQAAQALLRDVANALPAALIVLTRQLKMQYCNRAAGALAVIVPQDPKTQEVNSLFPPLAPHLAGIVAAAQDQQVIELPRQVWPGDEGQRIVNIAAYPLSTAAAGGIVIRIDDVTERTLLEEMMIRSEKLSSIGGLAAGIAHEINNPLGVMVQAVQNIERRISEQIEANRRAALELGTDIATVRAYLEKRSILVFLDDIKNDGARAAKIVRNLLDYSRKTEPVLESTDLANLIERAVELARKDYDLKKNYDFRRIDLKVDLAADLPLVPMIRSEVEQVILNLLKNSAQAMYEAPRHGDGHDRPEITIRACTTTDFAELRVQDNGPGFSEEAKRRAFEPFFTTKAPGIGTGLGLWVSYMILTDKHRGQFLLESEPGQGATFIMRFPL